MNMRHYTDNQLPYYLSNQQIPIFRFHFERMPKPVLVATQEYINDEIYYRNPAKETPEAGE